ncbi:MAG: 1-deoxy-D-xylulose-5-phosphate reductoisomerase [Kiritimatiellae bacterium]|nr:1-deoxy-D-xylulose-5-phosphate reductoisomerase [Kiritimatiellia bacterium]
MTPKKIIVLGATGSIGDSAVAVMREHRNEFKPVAFVALKSKEKCEALAAEFSAKSYVGEGAALKAIEENDADLCLVALVGESGIEPTLAAIEKGMDIALATKEVLVMEGAKVMAAAKRRGVKMLPVDSEHSAIFQCIQQGGEVERLILTASGGPFLDSPSDLSKVTVEEALNHPSWKMGPKVTIDSSTMMNKGFEIIEAHWLFSIPPDKIDVVVHPQSIVHSLVEFKDGATLAQLSPPDMRVAIQYALSWPQRLPSKREVLDLAQIGKLEFRAPDLERFPALSLAKKALLSGGTAARRLAEADEKAVNDFLQGKILYTDIIKKCEEALNND